MLFAILANYNIWTPRLIIVFILLVAAGPFLELNLIFTVADIVNGAMAIPNLIGLIGLSGVVIKETEEYFYKSKNEKSS